MIRHETASSLRLGALAAAAALSIAALAMPAAAAPIAALGGHDIGALMSRAEERFDVPTLDAVVLLDDTEIVFEQDGSMSRTTHLVVWFSTELGLDTYADLRVPYNTDTSEFEVHALRTWRDGTWWPHETELSPTAIVETTPYACQNADDYTTMREVMLLHDGVELPCIVETAYTVKERRDPALGSDGMWVVPGADPTVVKSLSVTAPGGTQLHWTTVPGAPEPEVMRTQEHGVTHRWVAEDVDRLPRPLTGDATAHEPYVVWSTWGDWSAMGAAVASALEGAAALTESLRDSVATVTDGVPLALARAEAVADFLRETTRGVNYDDSYWRFDPRPAARTWETAYGHRLDRAALATALMREAGVEVTPVFTTPGRTEVDPAVPALAWFGGLELTVGDEAVLDPVDCRLRHGTAWDLGKTVWRAGAGPAVISLPGSESFYALALSLERGDDGWSGSATLETSGALSAQPSALGLSGETESFVGSVARSAIGATAENVGIARFEAAGVTAGFALTMDAPEPDDSGRTTIVMGDPEGGIVSQLPGDVHTYEADRDSPVLLPGPMRQTVTLVLDPGDAEFVRTPEPLSLENALGEFSLTVDERGDGRIVVVRSLSIGRGRDPGGRGGGLIVAARDWRLLRALLLEETDPRHRTLMLK